MEYMGEPLRATEEDANISPVCRERGGGGCVCRDKVERICTSAIRYRLCLHYIQHCVSIITLTAGLTQDGLEDQTVAR